MKVIWIRLEDSAAERDLKYETFFRADEKTQIRMIPCGHFVVSRNGVNVLVTHAKVRTACISFDDQPAERAARATEDDKPTAKRKAK